MNKKELCTLAYQLVAGFDDIKDEEFVKDIIFAIAQKEEYTIVEMLEQVEMEDEY